MVKTKKYFPQEIEPRWQKRWAQDGLYRARVDWNRPKHYALTMLPYPSGDLHIGHWYATAPSDARARYMRMRGYNVLFPMCFDAFGLPAENAAIKHGVHPHKWTMENIARMRRQLKSMGAIFDWDREVISCLPEYYKWTQWFFLKFYEKGLAYRKFAPVDFCPRCNTTLAREQVWGEDRHCERCGTPVIRKELEQWFFKITDYAEELLDFSKIDWPERVVAMQTNWIGKSEGAEVVFKVAPSASTSNERQATSHEFSVFTTRPDTLWGVTFMVLAPEHPLVSVITTPDRRAEIQEYTAQATRQTEIVRLAADREKTGVFTGAYAINPVNGERVPIWIADYVMMGYGTGAIMGVPAHDERDFAFAFKYGLPVLPVIDRPDGACRATALARVMKEGYALALKEAGFVPEVEEGWVRVAFHKDRAAEFIKITRENFAADGWVEIVGGRWIWIFPDGVRELNSLAAEREILIRCKELEPNVRSCRTLMEMLQTNPYYRDLLFHAEYGTMINSGPFTGTPGEEARAKVIAWLAEKGLGKPAVNYRLRDWLISRQRYWGAPIPIIYCEKCGTVPVPYEDLPVLLPEDAEFLPTGESPLKYHEAFRRTTCPRCGGPAERETDTMDTFICSSWYQYAYLSPYHKGDLPFDREEARYWLPVDMYTGGVEHACMHLIYTRFFTKAMRDLGLVDFDEPMLALRNQGVILGEDSEKMSKSRGNVIAPDELVEKYGADTVRAYLMFGWRWEQGGPWDSRGIEGVYRFLHRAWDLLLAPPQEKKTAGVAEERALRRKVHQTIRRCTRDMEDFSFNTYIAALMELANAMREAKPALHATQAWEEAVRNFLLLLAPVWPHFAEEGWSLLGYEYSVHNQAWPTYNPELAAEETFELVIQVNGRIRDKVVLPVDVAEEEAKRAALAAEGVQAQLAGKVIKKLVYVPGKLVNIVV
ncbi:MAG: leucine--tRNA ligase [Firmicutes bacterium]|nr:leucine--tRNA ligase [Bacillota bacterium]